MASGVDEIANWAVVELLLGADGALAVLEQHGLAPMVQLGAWLQPLDTGEPPAAPRSRRSGPAG